MRPCMPRLDLSPEMSSLINAIKAPPVQAHLPGLEDTSRVRYVGHGWWRVDGAPRCWHTVTIQALLRRRLLTREAPRILRAAPPLTCTTDA